MRTASRSVNVLRFASLLLVGLLAGVVLTHPLEIPGKAALTVEEWLAVQNHLYGGYAIFGAIAEIAGLIMTLGLGLLLVRRRELWAALPFFAATCLGAMLAIFWLGLNPINQTVSGGTPATLAPYWTEFRARWDALHMAGFALAFAAFCSLLIEALWHSDSKR